jgi:3-dehydroquinate synthase
MSLQTVHVNVPGHPYDVLVEPGLLNSAGQRLRQLSGSAKAGLVTDSHVAPLYADDVRQSLQSAGFDVIEATIPAGEQHKTLHTLATIYDQLLSAGVERSTPLLALGGGVVGDMTGFAAATILRGIPFVQIPTTLLSMVDASVGGKTAIDHTVGKNLIGAFHQPIAVLIDPAVLRTLPDRELRSGLAECIKHEIIRDVDGFATLERNITRAIALDVDYLAELVAHNVAIKARVVEADPFEKGERAHLNFGHTYGHAIETISNYAYAHGEAVALGMVAASYLASDLGMLDLTSVSRIVNLIAQAGLPTSGLRLDPQRIVSCMIYDKKVKSGRVRFVLPDRIGHVVVGDDVPEERVIAAVKKVG